MIKDNINSFLTFDVFPKLEKYMDALPDNFSGQTIQLSRLSLNIEGKSGFTLGTILENSITEAFEKELTASLKPIMETGYTNNSSEENRGISLLTEQEKHLRTFLHFLENGYMPWWNSGENAVDILKTDVFKKIISAEGFEKSVASVMQKPAVRRRIVNQLTDPQIKQLCLSVGKYNAFSLNLDTGLVKQLPQLPVAERNTVWSLILDILAGYVSQSAVNQEGHIFQQVVKSVPALHATRNNSALHTFNEIIKTFPQVEENAAIIKMRDAYFSRLSREKETENTEKEQDKLKHDKQEKDKPGQEKEAANTQKPARKRNRDEESATENNLELFKEGKKRTDKKETAQSDPEQSQDTVKRGRKTGTKKDRPDIENEPGQSSREQNHDPAEKRRKPVAEKKRQENGNETGPSDGEPNRTNTRNKQGKSAPEKGSTDIKNEASQTNQAKRDTKNAQKPAREKDLAHAEDREKNSNPLPNGSNLQPNASDTVNGIPSPDKKKDSANAKNKSGKRNQEDVRFNTEGNTPQDGTYAQNATNPYNTETANDANGRTRKQNQETRNGDAKNKLRQSSRENEVRQDRQAKAALQNDADRLSNKTTYNDAVNNNTYDKADEDGAYYVQNAGLIIVHPFMNNLFKYCGLVDPETQKLIDAELCVHLLHYIATGKTNQPESNMLFEKFLCNIPVQQSISRHIKLSRKHKTHAKKVISAVQENWSAMKNASVELLQYEFLQRPGKLVIDDNLTLTIERKAQDILLDRMSWGFGLVKLPWKKDFVYVNW